MTDGLVSRPHTFKSKIFRNIETIILLFFSVVFMIHVMLPSVYHYDKSDYRVMTLFTDLALFNLYHVGLSYACLGGIQEFKEVYYKTHSVWLRWFIPTAVLLLTFFLYDTIFHNKSTGIFVIGFINWISIYHFVGQTRGISLIETHKSLPQKYSFFRKVEGWLSIFVLVLLFLDIFQSRLHNLFDPNLLSGLATAGIVFVFGLSFYCFRLQSPAKGVLVLRYIPYLAVMYSYFALFFVMAIHAIEYCRINKNVFYRTKPRRKNFFFIFAAFTIMFTMVSIGQFLGFEGSDRQYFKWIWTFGKSAVIFHTYLDFRFYRFKNPVAKKHIAPLVTY